MLALKLFCTVLLADLVSGLVHWAEDAYARPGMPLVSRIAENNLLHHRKPRAFLANSWWESSADLLAIGAAILALAWWQDALTVWLLLFVLLAVNANQIHKWTHMSRREVPRIVGWLQRARILQTPREHARHHTGEKNSHYCVMTNVSNPVLEKLRFWTALEWLVEKTTGVRRRADSEYPEVSKP
ncbi:MAG: fatty acid desaturase CarF family protein [Pseudomonadota bacterium]